MELEPTTTKEKLKTHHHNHQRENILDLSECYSNIQGRKQIKSPTFIVKIEKNKFEQTK